MNPITFNQTAYYPGTNSEVNKVLCIAGDHTGFNGTAIDGVLQAYPGRYKTFLVRHFSRHLEPFRQPGR